MSWAVAGSGKGGDGSDHCGGKGGGGRGTPRAGTGKGGGGGGSDCMLLTNKIAIEQTKFIKILKTCGKFYKAALNGKRKEKTKCLIFFSWLYGGGLLGSTFVSKFCQHPALSFSV